MLAVFESHPVQYRAPVYRELQRLAPNRFHVFYATDISVRGNRDVDFGKTLSWDEPLLDGYPNTILGLENGEPLKGFGSLHGRNLAAIFDRHRPTAVLQTQYLYRYDFAIRRQALRRAIPIWTRMETQDEANERSGFKALLRSIAYRLLYRTVDKAFYIGELNRDHYLRHGLKPSQLVRAPYCTPDRFSAVSSEQFQSIRMACREKLNISPERIVVGFFGKLIPKKNPDLLISAFSHLPPELKSRAILLYVGSGRMEPELRAKVVSVGVSEQQVRFVGFVNQSEIRDYYAATDIMVLPSRRQGETWGLVVNEALQAGCSVVVTEAVGCHREFGQWERVRIIPVEAAEALARALTELSVYPRDFCWARELMKAYSTEAAAQAFANGINCIG